MGGSLCAGEAELYSEAGRLSQALKVGKELKGSLFLSSEQHHM